MADYDIFREQLAIKYPKYGHALWEPKPAKPNNPVKVGDVGFIRDGQFHCLFNALLSAEDQSDVPEHYEQLVPKLSDHLRRNTLSSNHYCSDGIAVERESSVQALGPDDFDKVSFLNSRRRGAVLSLPVDARREDTLAKGDFSGWIVRHIDHWFAFARDLGLGIERMEEIILVTGCDHTRSWTNIAFFGTQNNTQASFGVKVTHGSPISVIDWLPLPESVQGAVLHRGPSGANLPDDQCVFIRGFRVTRPFRILPKNLKAAAGPSPDPDGYDGEPGIEVVSIPGTPEYQDPLHTLQDYVAERVPDCEMVLVHDDDLVAVDELKRGVSPEKAESLGPDVIMDLLRGSDIEIHNFLYDLPSTNSLSGASTGMATVKVAMLSRTFHNQNTASSSQWSLTVPDINLCHTSEPRRMSPPAAWRHRDYFFLDGDVTFKVEDTFFRVHKFFFTRDSSYFRQLLVSETRPGKKPLIPRDIQPSSSETNPIVLKDTASEAFEGLCWVFYNPNYSIYTTTVEKWVEILALAQKWEFQEVEQLCIRELENLPIEPVEKIDIYQANHLDRSLLAESFEHLTLRSEPLTLEEGLKLGMETTIQIARARELSRGLNPNIQPSTIQVNYSDLHSIIQGVFGINRTIGLLDGSVAVTPTSPPKRMPKDRKPKKK